MHPEEWNWIILEIKQFYFESEHKVLLQESWKYLQLDLLCHEFWNFTIELTVSFLVSHEMFRKQSD